MSWDDWKRKKKLGPNANADWAKAEGPYPPPKNPGPPPVKRGRGRPRKVPKEPDITWQINPEASIPPDERVIVTPYQIMRSRELLGEMAKRKIETLRIFEPLPVQKELAECGAKEILARGSNRGAKTTGCAYNFAQIVTGCHPVLSGKRNGTPREFGRAGIVGYDLDHIGRVLFPILFKPGAIKIIRDEITGQWRTFKAWMPADKEREHEAKQAPPFIPPRLIAPKGISWLIKNRNIPKRVVLLNGWEIYFFSSEGEPPQGDSYQLFWFDEEIRRQDFYAEVSARLGTGKGFFQWSATPHVGGDDLIELHDRANQQRLDKVPRVREFFFSMDSNPHFDIAERELLKEKYKNRPEEYRVRILGEYAAHGFKVYPEYHLDIHGLPIQEACDPQTRQIPATWARWAVVDPGRQTCAVLFVAIPPGNDFAVAYDELYISQCTAIKFAEQMEIKTRGQSFEAFYIDSHAGRVHEIAGGKQIEWQYAEELRKLKVFDRVRTKTFLWGADDVKAGIEAGHRLLHIDPHHGRPMFRVLVDAEPDEMRKARLVNFDHEFKHYFYKRDGRRLTDEPERRDNHLMDCFRYFAMANPKFRKPKIVLPEKSWVSKRMEAKRKKASEGGFINLGPSGRSSRRMAA